MGEIRNYTCKCGYTKDIFRGVGFMAHSLTGLDNLFPEEVKLIRQEQEKGNEIYFFSDNIVTVCPKCKELRNVARLKYQLSDGVKRETFIENCDSCGEKTIAVMSEAISCPRCGKPMEHRYAGNWD